jgi:Protein of unknown function (DUF565)
MQRTRLSTLANVTSTRFNSFFSNPWRRISLQIICILLGTFVGQAVVTTSGQTAQWDVTAAGLLVLFTEAISRIVYRQSSRAKPALILRESFNLLKIGITYSLFLEAFKIGS